MPARHPLRLFLFAACPLIAIGLYQDVELRWTFESALGEAGFAATRSTPGVVAEQARFAPDSVGGGLILNVADDALLVAERLSAYAGGLPEEAVTLSAWVALERTQRWGGIVSAIQDNGEAEKGILLGYEDDRFSFGLATTGADDGDGRLTYLRGRTPIRLGGWHHVAATFDGEVARLYVDGELDAETEEQTGRVLYDDSAPFVLGSYRDENEDYPVDGRLLEVEISGAAWTAEEVTRAFAKRAHLIELEPWTDLEFEFLVDPFLTWPTAEAMSVAFETTFPTLAELQVWPDHGAPEDARVLRASEPAALHTFRAEGLSPDQKYFYRVRATRPSGEALESEVLSFRTASSPGRAFTFVVVGDTQTNGAVAKRVADLAWMHRPNLVVHAGDLVDAGTNKRDWTDVFFPSLQPLIGRVPIMPVLGNHEQDADHYYRYMTLPEPERWYSFTYADAEFFMLDGNRSLADQSEQLSWLEGALRASEAKWRFAVLHQPPYTSDSNDYGDTLVGTSTRGDENVRNIVALLERYDVDICFSGHVHDYERTFPIRDGKVTPYEDGGVIYVTAAGGGGPLEDFDPTNTWFGHKKARYHHLVYIGIHGDHLELQAIDEDGRLFDTVQLEKR